MGQETAVLHIKFIELFDTKLYPHVSLIKIKSLKITKVTTNRIEIDSIISNSSEERDRKRK